MKNFLLLTCLLAFAANCLFAANEAVKPEGEGTVESPYLLTKVENLVWMGENIAECQSNVFRLENDIDASETKDWARRFGTQYGESFGFVPIGSRFLSKDGQNHKFSGTIDGQDYAIKNLFSRAHYEDACGSLFYQLLGANISNIKLHNINFGRKDVANMSVGALARNITDSTITNVHATGQLNGRFAGGIATSAKNSNFSNCSFVGKIKGASVSVNIGGIIGECTDCKFVCCRTSGSALSSSEKGSTLGGLFGRINYGTTDVLYCYSDMRLSAKVGVVGGLVGANNMENYEDYYGYITIGDFGFKQCYSNCEIEAAPGVASGGIAGWVTNSVCFNCHYNSDKVSGSGFGTGVNSTKIKKRSTFSNWNFGKIWEINEGFSTPYFAAESGRYLKPALIGDWFGAVKVQPEKDGYGYGETVTVIAEPYEGAEFLNYSGTLEGGEASKTLTIEENVTVEANFAKQIMSIDIFGGIGKKYPWDEQYVQISDFDLSGIDFTNRIVYFSGSYDGRSHSILNWKNSNWKDYGLFKEIYGATLYNLNIVDLYAEVLDRGILVTDRAALSIISNCYILASINLSGEGSYGICGMAQDSTITKCNFIGEILGKDSHFGGLCAAGYNLLLDQCGVELYSNGRYVYCFMEGYGLNAKAVNCFARGNFTGQLSNGVLSNCYLNAQGNISLYGGQFINCYFNSNYVTHAENVTGLVSPEEMKKQETYAGWDFDEIWDIDEGVGTPYFRYALPEPVEIFALLLLALLAMRKR